MKFMFCCEVLDALIEGYSLHVLYGGLQTSKL
jgi:hypothetical protein